MTVMADTTPLHPGTLVKCVLLSGKEISGEVHAFDQTKGAVLILTEPTDKSQHNTTDIHLVNLNNVKSFKVVKEPANTRPPNYPNLDQAKLHKRLREKCKEKKSKIDSIGVGVTQEAQDLFDTIRKTIDDCVWEGTTIVVMGDVDIREPYSIEDLHTRPGRKKTTIGHIIKIVERFREKETRKSA